MSKYKYDYTKVEELKAEGITTRQISEMTNIPMDAIYGYFCKKNKKERLKKEKEELEFEYKHTKCVIADKLKDNGKLTNNEISEITGIPVIELTDHWKSIKRNEGVVTIDKVKVNDYLTATERAVYYYNYPSNYVVINLKNTTVPIIITTPINMQYLRITIAEVHKSELWFDEDGLLYLRVPTIYETHLNPSGLIKERVFSTGLYKKDLENLFNVEFI